jgi:hypothetical protein
LEGGLCKKKAEREKGMGLYNIVAKCEGMLQKISKIPYENKLGLSKSHELLYIDK